MTEKRVLYADIVPYEVPNSLASLCGPAGGPLRLPLHLWWAPGPTFDLTNRLELLVAYRAIVRDGRTRDQEELLNAALLVVVWPALRLPVRCRWAWEDAFSELTG